MSKFTKDAPFEFEGVKVWRDREMVRYTGRADLLASTAYQEYVNAFHAFIEAERDEWHWTNDEHTEARKGRWVAESGVKFEWSMRHQDLLNIVCVHPSPGDRSYHRSVREALDDFLAWKSAQEQPDEPTGLGAVVEVGDKRWTRSPEGAGDSTPWCHNESGSWNDWTGILTFGPVTVLSEGVAS